MLRTFFENNHFYMRNSFIKPEVYTDANNRTKLYMSLY